MLIYAIILFVHGLLNQFGIRLVALLNDISVWWHILGVLIIVAVLAFAPSHHQSASFVFGHFFNGTGLAVPAFYIVLIGLLLAQYTFTGYDASAHMTEETRDAATAGPRGIVMSIVVSLIAGWVLLIGVTFAIQNYSRRVGSPRCLRPRSSWTRSAQTRRGAAAADRVRRPAVLRHVVGHRQLPDDLRVLPGRRAAVLGLLARVNKRTRTPTNAIWLAAVGALILGLPYLWNPPRTRPSPPSRSSACTSPT